VQEPAHTRERSALVSQHIPDGRSISTATRTTASGSVSIQLSRPPATPQMVSGLHAVVKLAGVSDSDIRTENFTGY
jgi:hypothetical protein